MDSHLIQTDNGEYIWFNPETNCYEMVDETSLNKTKLPETRETNIAGMNYSISNPGTSKSNYSKMKENIPEIVPEISSSVIKPNTWSRDQTLLFLDLCSQNKERLTNIKYKKSEVYKDIAMLLQNKGHNFSADQCTNRFKTLIAKYKTIRDHNSQSGNSRKDWVFLSLWQNFLVTDLELLPEQLANESTDAEIFTAETSTAGTSTNGMSIAGTSTTETCTKRTSDGCAPKVKRICKRNSPKVEMVKWLQEYKKEVSEREERKIALAKEQHEENKKIMADILNLIKKDRK